jgi:hypothetical protein
VLATRARLTTAGLGLPKFSLGRNRELRLARP